MAVVFVNRQRRATVKPERVARWTWEELEVTTLSELKELAQRSDLGQRVLRLRVDMQLAAPDYELAEELLEALEGTEARHGKVGVLDLDRQGLELDTSNVDSFCNELPEILRSAVRRLKLDADDPLKRATAQRALFHLYRVSRKKAS